MPVFDKVKDAVQSQIVEKIKDTWGLDLSDYDCNFYDEAYLSTGFNFAGFFEKGQNTVYIEDISIDFEYRLTYMSRLVLED